MDNRSNTPDRAHPDIVVVAEHDDGGRTVIAVDVEHHGDHEHIVIEIVDIEECGRDNRPPPVAHSYRVKIDHVYHVIRKRFVTGRELLVIAEKKPPEHYEIEKRMHGGHYVAIELEQTVDLGECGIEVFETFPLDETEG